MKKERFLSLRVKLTIGVVVICFVIGLISILSVQRIATDVIDKEYRDRAEQIAEAVVTTIDPEEAYEITDLVMTAYRSIDKVIPSTEWGTDEWNAYMSNYEGIEELPLFQKLRDDLRVYQDIFNVDCIYFMNYQTDVKHAIYILDAAYEDAGCLSSGRR